MSHTPKFGQYETKLIVTKPSLFTYFTHITRYVRQLKVPHENTTF
jgi:hypothetical protein